MPALFRHPRLLVLLACALCTWVAPDRTAWAQGTPDQGALLKRASEQVEQDKGKPIGPSAVRPLTVNVQWQLWKQVVIDGKDGAQELVTLRQSLVSTGQRNHLSFTLGAIAWLKQADVSGEQAARASANLWMISPDMPHGYLAHAYWTLRHNTGAIGPLTESIFKGVPRLWTWPDMGTMWRYNFMGVLLLGLLLASAGFLLTQTIRHFGTLCFDASRLLPKTLTQTQTTLLLLALIILPGLVLGSVLLSALTLLTLLGVVQQVRERVVTLGLMGLLAALPLIEERMSHEATFHTSDAHVMFEAQYLTCDAACEARLDAMSAQRPKDSVLAYTQLLLALRKGQPQAQLQGWSEARVRAMPASIQPAAMNLYGASLAARMQHAEATKILKLAASMDATHAGPHLNLMRVAQAQGLDDDISVHIRRANELNLMGTTAFLALKRRDTNSMLWVDPLPFEVFMQHSVHVERVNTLPVISRLWPSLAGTSVPFAWSVYLGAGGFLVVLLSMGLVLKTKVSTPCPKCGLPRAPEDGARSGDHPYCSVCYRTYIDGVSLSPQERANSEDRIASRQATRRLLTRVLSVGLPGSGHVLMGQAVLGFVVSAVFSVGLLFILEPHGVWPASHALLEVDWFGTRALSWLCLLGALFVGLLGAWRGIASADVRTRKHPIVRGPHD